MPIPVILALAVYQVLLIFVHLALYATLIAAFGFGSPFMQWMFILLAVSFIAMSLLTFHFKDELIARAYAVSAYWFGLSHFLFMGCALFTLAAYFLYGANIYIAPAILGGIFFG